MISRKKCGTLKEVDSLHADKHQSFLQVHAIFLMGWLSCVKGIIAFICQSKTITNGYLYLKNEGRGRDGMFSNNVLLLFAFFPFNKSSPSGSYLF